MPFLRNRSVLMCLPSDTSNGTLSAVNDLIEEIIKLEVKVYVAYISSQEISIENPCNQSRYVIKRHRGLFIFDVIYLARYIRDECIDVVHSHLSTFFLAALSARFAGVPSLRTIHGSLDRPGMLSYRNRLSFLISIYFLSQKVIAVSDKVALDVQKYYGLKIGKGVFEIPNGYRVTDELIEAPYPIQDKLIFAFVGRFEDMKGFPELIRAFRRLYNNDQSVQLLLIGDGDRKSMVDKHLISSGAIVLSPGWIERDKVINMLHKSHVFVLPSHSEGLSIALLEAMSIGLTPLVSEAATASNLVTHEINGLIFKVGSEDELHNEMQKIASNEDLIHRYRQSAMETVNKNFNITITARKHIEIYQSLLRDNN